MNRRILIGGAASGAIVVAVLLVLLWNSGIGLVGKAAATALLLLAGAGIALTLRSAVLGARRHVNDVMTTTRNNRVRVDEAVARLNLQGAALEEVSGASDETLLVQQQLSQAVDAQVARQETQAAAIEALVAENQRLSDRFKALTDRLGELTEWNRRLEEAAGNALSQAGDAAQGFQSLRREMSLQRSKLTETDGAVSTLEEQGAFLSKRIDLVDSESSPLFDRFRVLDEQIVQYRDDASSIDSRLFTVETRSFENALAADRRIVDVITADEAKVLAERYFAAGQYLQLKPLLETFGVEEHFNLTEMRTAFKFFRRSGYFGPQQQLARRVAALSGKPNDAAALKRTASEVAVYEKPYSDPSVLGDSEECRDVGGPVMHIVGKALPEVQTGYTLRTHYSMRALQEIGIPVIVVCQAGAPGGEADRRVEYELDGVRYIILAGPSRLRVTYEEWLAQNMKELSDVVRAERPSVLHAHSDFFNAAMMNQVGHWLGIPTAYETRGFWEESWLSRTLDALAPEGVTEERLHDYGLPDSYVLRRQAEIAMREQSDANLTLGRTMEGHIRSLASPGTIEEDPIPLVPNGIDPEAFTVQERDAELAESLGFTDEDVVIGYVSSIVEYEGIDILLEAFHRMRSRVDSETGSRAKLLLVGDGDRLQQLKDYVRAHSVPDVVFTGRVPHTEILKYYGLIDLFVVPRRPTLVSRLVTPLKPFEALASGRAVVVSDVEALKEIVEDSDGAVEIFRAGDPLDLCDVLERLLADPARRREMAEEGSKWVAQYRTWTRNALIYARLYVSLGMRLPNQLDVDALLALDERDIDFAAILEAVAARPAAPISGWFQQVLDFQRLEDMRTDGWILEGSTPVSIEDLHDWKSNNDGDRSWVSRLQAFEFLDPFLSEYDSTGDPGLLEEALSFVMTWAESERRADDPTSMAHFVMAVSRRIPRFIALFTRLVQQPGLDAQKKFLFSLLCDHEQEISEESFFTSSTNHGFYIAAAQLHIAKYLPECSAGERAEEIGSSRMRTMIETQFASDGGHLEHSPAYHRMLLQSFRDAIDDGIICDESVVETIDRAEHVLGWFIQPDGHLVQFGDTSAEDMRNYNPEPTDPATRFLTTCGREGVPESETSLVLPKSGYAFVRDPQPTTGAEIPWSSYLAFQAGFHSRAHKHADDLSFVWFENGIALAVDPGSYGYGKLLPADDPLRRYGFYYDSEERRYVESTSAHNALEMDGEIQDRRRPPFGSGLIESTHESGTYTFIGRASHTNYVHRRRLSFHPARRLEVVDTVYSHLANDRSGVAWFNLNGELDLLDNNGADLRFLLPDDQGVLVIESDGELEPPVKGQLSPRRGWRSVHEHELAPSWSFGYRFDVSVRGGVKTSLRLEGPVNTTA